LNTKAEEQKIAINKQVSEFIARQFKNNIRELEGAFSRVIAYSKLTREPLTVDLVQHTLQDITPANQNQSSPSPASIINAVSNYFKVSSDSLSGKARSKQIALARQVAIYIIREETGLPLEQIGKILGGRDHSTIIHSYSKISSLLESESELKNSLSEIKDTIYSRNCS
jgi:chromosomal replication initiator protein